jgi:TRAP-type C4-dicarboxylate transport system permease small subunit
MSSLDQAKEKEVSAVSVQPCALDRWVLKIGKTLSLIFLASAAIIMIEIIARYVFNSPTFWVHETTTLLCAICFIYGGSHCLARNGHIRIGLLYDSVSKRVQRWLDIFIAFMGIIYSLTMTAAAWIMMTKALYTPWGEFRLETSGSAWDPPLPAIVKTTLFLMLVLMTVQFVLHFFIHVRRDSNA